MEIDIKQLIGILLKRWLIITLALIIGLLSAFLITKYAIDPIYSASTTLYVYNSESRKNSATITTSDIAVSKTLVDTYIVILESDTVLNEVAAQSGLGYTADEIRRMISADSVNNTEVLRVTVSNKVPQHAQVLAAAIVEVAPPQIIRVVHGGSVEVIDQATLPTKPTSPNVMQNTIIGGLLGLIISIMGAVLFEMLDTRIRTEDDLTELFEIPVIGVIPSFGVNAVSKKGGVSGGK